MHPNALQPGFLVEVHADELTFPAVVKKKEPKVVTVEPLDPITFQRRHVLYSQIVAVLQRPEPDGAVA
jgi:hypothetical protein